jgi:tetratricopeptide (TPR) repeat protein
MKLARTCCVICCLSLLFVPLVAAGTLLQRAEDLFFHALVEDPTAREQALSVLRNAWAADPTHARTNLLLGLAHLWTVSASEGSAALEHLLLAEEHLARARELNPSDGRIVTWLSPVRIALAHMVDGDEQAAEEAWDDLYAAFMRDPAFHSFSVAAFSFQEPRESPRFQRALRAIRQMVDCAPDDPSCMNTPRWPHNREAYFTFLSDVELKAGHAERARTLLEKAREEPSFDTWSFREETLKRLESFAERKERFSDRDPSNDPRPMFGYAGTASCTACHAR